MKIYFHPLSQPSRAVQWFAANHGIKAEFVTVNLMTGENTSPEFTAKTPYQSVPILELDDGTIITESGAIIVYLAEVNQVLAEYPQDPLKRAKIHEALLHHDGLARQVTLSAIRPLFAKLLKPDTPWEAIAAALKERAAEFKYALSLIELILSKNKFIAGPEFTIADYLVISELNQVEHADEVWEGVDEECMLSRFPAIQRYLGDAASLPNYAVNAEPLKQLAPLFKMASSPL